jgi:hypothetical protein
MRPLLEDLAATMARKISEVRGLDRERALRRLERHLLDCGLDECPSCQVYRMVFPALLELDQMAPVGNPPEQPVVNSGDNFAPEFPAGWQHPTPGVSDRHFPEGSHAPLTVTHKFTEPTTSTVLSLTLALEEEGGVD